jgi:uncharacterized protein (DUF488 family)
VGHSNRTAAEFLAILKAHGVARVADVRSAPWSRRHPQYNREALAATLRHAGLDYAHLPALGGMRAPDPASRHRALAPGGFRGYADHMDSATFERGVAALLEWAAGAATAIMCAEADPAHCHRSLLADALVARGSAVVHLLDASARRAHALHPGAVVRHGRVAYPGRPDLFDLPAS